MKDIVEFIVKQFVSNPEAVEVTEQEQEGYLNILLKVAPEDMGLTIGKSGQTIKAIRRLLTIKAISENVRVNLELVDSGAPATVDAEAEVKVEEEETEEAKKPEAEEEPEAEEKTEDSKKSDS